VSLQPDMTCESETRTRTGTFMGNLVPVLGLYFIGYPLSRATIRTMLIGWILILAAMTQFILRRCLLKRFLNEAPK
jgi:uncharacterized membrane protein HdeD (DUF308 family)